VRAVWPPAAPVSVIEVTGGDGTRRREGRREHRFGTETVRGEATRHACRSGRRTSQRRRGGHPARTPGPESRTGVTLCARERGPASERPPGMPSTTSAPATPPGRPSAPHRGGRTGHRAGRRRRRRAGDENSAARAAVRWYWWSRPPTPPSFTISGAALRGAAAVAGWPTGRRPARPAAPAADPAQHGRRPGGSPLPAVGSAATRPAARPPPDRFRLGHCLAPPASCGGRRPARREAPRVRLTG
jgi:hypothetical protein